MRHTKKGSEPNALIEYRLRPGAKWDGDNAFSEVKAQLRGQLVRDQGWLCCYCMCRIEPAQEAMSIEHWACRSRYEDQQLVWSNLLGVCPGDQKGHVAGHHCDRSKRDDDITISPLNRAHIGTISFSASGKITSSNTSFDDEINRQLNLNTRNLINNRNAAVRAFQQEIQMKYPGRSVLVETLRRRLDKSARSGDRLPPFWGAIEFWIGRRLRRAKGE